MTRDEQKARLVDMLTNAGFRWRSIEQLSKGAQADLLTTRALLAEIGARRSTGTREVYTLGTAEAIELPGVIGGEGD